MGDFNEVLKDSEKIWGESINITRDTSFSNCVNHFKLIYLGSKVVSLLGITKDIGIEKVSFWKDLIDVWLMRLGSTSFLKPL